MNFKTTVPIEPQKHNTIDHGSKLFLVGSCFSEHIGKKFETFEFLSTSNPLGILFHPLAIERLITRAINEQSFAKDELVEHKGLFCSLDAHSKFNHTDAEIVLSNLNQALSQTKKALEEATHVFITLGTAWAYRYIQADELVANCHKIPQKQFLKELLSVERVKNSLEATVSLIAQLNPKATFIFTISPVRHLKDGFSENNRSKSHLIAAAHELVEESRNVHYFPSYELVMDELRDYRFYKEDMVHPSEQAVHYIWDRFAESWLSAEAQALFKELKALRDGEAHRPFHPESDEHQRFKNKLEKKRIELNKRITELRKKRPEF